MYRCEVCNKETDGFLKDGHILCYEHATFYLDSIPVKVLYKPAEVVAVIPRRKLLGVGR